MCAIVRLQKSVLVQASNAPETNSDIRTAAHPTADAGAAIRDHDCETPIPSHMHTRKDITHLVIGPSRNKGALSPMYIAGMLRVADVSTNFPLEAP